MSKKTEKLQLNIQYEGADKVQTWRDGMDENFVKLDETFGNLLEAISDAADEFARVVDLEETNSAAGQ